MPVRPLSKPGPMRMLASHGEVRSRRKAIFAFTAILIAIMAWLMTAGLFRDGPSASDLVLLGLYLPNIAWSAFAAATAVCGAIWYRDRPRAFVPAVEWRPHARTAILVPARNEDAPALERRLADLRADLAQRALGATIDIFILSDSDAAGAIDAEARLAERFATDGGRGPAIYYRRRTDNAHRKPGNIAEWLQRWGGGYGYMLVLDADSRMSAKRIASLIYRMEQRPELGLVQTGVRLTGAESRFARLQQLATRLYGAAFASGIAGWSGDEGNYWGHNALIRVKAFAQAAGLPQLPGYAPFGGDILSHDFIEAAWLRRAGWAIEIDPDSWGSAEGGPETLGEFTKRDRRWCQGNMQHMRILGAVGLHPVSRLHLICGIMSYLAAPLWIALVLAAVVIGASGYLLLPALGALVLILLQKAAGISIWLQRRPGAWRTVVRLSAGELALSTLMAPVIMLHQTIAVFSVLSGADCGWKPAQGAGPVRSENLAWVEPAVGLSILATVLPGIEAVWQVALILPIVVPLVIAPIVVAWLDRVPRHEPLQIAVAPVPVVHLEPVA